MRHLSRISTLAAAAALALSVSIPAAWGADTESRGFRYGFPQGQGTVRFANLAGRVELVPGPGNQVVVDATVHADGDSAKETQELLQGMKWVRGHDKEGREEWTLSYPVGRYRAFHYPRETRNGGSDLPSFLSFLENGYTSTTYLGERVRIYSKKRSSAPTLYVNLRIALPAGSNVVVRNVVGPVGGNGALQGKLGVKTGSGDVKIASYDGQLTVDTGSGDVTVRQGMASRILADTGSGDVQVLGVDLEELSADTGSGDVIVRSSLDRARSLVAETGSGDVRIEAGPDASFDIDSDQGSGDLMVGYDDAELRRSGRKVVGAKRGDGRTHIRVETGSGDCVIKPRAES